MGKDELTILETDLATQMTFVRSIVATLEERIHGVRPDDPVRLESIAYQIHNLYNSVEDLLKLVAGHFENNIADPSRWHTELLYRMTQEINGVRPALISADAYRLLNGWRGFRHFFRHAYSVPIEFDQLEINIRRARQLFPALSQDVDRFLQKLKGELSEAT